MPEEEIKFEEEEAFGEQQVVPDVKTDTHEEILTEGEKSQGKDGLLIDREEDENAEGLEVVNFEDEEPNPNGLLLLRTPSKTTTKTAKTEMPHKN